MEECFDNESVSWFRFWTAEYPYLYYIMNCEGVEELRSASDLCKKAKSEVCKTQIYLSPLSHMQGIYLKDLEWLNWPITMIWWFYPGPPGGVEGQEWEMANLWPWERQSESEVACSNWCFPLFLTIFMGNFFWRTFFFVHEKRNSFLIFVNFDLFF